MKQLLTHITKKQRFIGGALCLVALFACMVVAAPSARAITETDENPGVSGKLSPDLSLSDPNTVSEPEAAASAAADPIIKCGPNSPADKDGSRWGKYFKQNYTLIFREPNRNSTRCAQGQKSHTVDYHCWVLGRDGYTWTYLRDATTRYAGWVRDVMLTNYGSRVHC